MKFRARTDDVAWKVVEGEAVLVHAESSAYYGLNRTGTALWEALTSGPCSPDELVSGLSQQLDAPPQQAGQDVDTFLRSLVGAGLATEVPDASETSSGSGVRLGRAASGPYEPPQVSPFGELEQLILSGE
ncbi:MAG: PqqD family protein [Gemmatimonadota bacterium]